MSRQFQNRSRAMSDTAFGVPCQSCKAIGIRPYAERPSQPGSFCPDCDGVGYTEVDPYQPSTNVAGSVERIVRYAARYRAGLPLWDPAEDCQTEYPESLGATPEDEAPDAEYADMGWDEDDAE